MRRRLLISNGDGITSESVAYGGTLVFTERPVEAVSFDCPECTHFVILNKTRDINSGTWGAVFTSVTSIKDGGTDVVSSYTTGKGGYSAYGYTDKQYAGKAPIVSFVETGVVMEVPDYSDTTRSWFGGGEYEWLAW